MNCELFLSLFCFDNLFGEIFLFLIGWNVETQHCFNIDSVWQLGSNVFQRDAIYQNASEQTLEIQLKMAQHHLSQNVHFIGFYENLWSDFELIHSTIFPDVEGTDWTRFLFNAGSAIGAQRLRTTKFSSQTDDEVLRFIREHNKYDMLLYEWALEHREKTFTLYSSYNELIALSASWIIGFCGLMVLAKKCLKWIQWKRLRVKIIGTVHGMHRKRE